MTTVLADSDVLVRGRSPAEAAAIRAAQVHAFRRQLAVIGTVHFTNGTLVAAVFFGRVNGWLLALWLAAIWLIAFQCIRSWFRHRHLPPAVNVPDRHFVRITRSAWVSGAIWGAAAAFLLPESSVTLQVFLVFVIAGMAAGTTAGLSQISHIWIGYVVPALTPLFVFLVVDGSQVALAIAGMTLVFVGALFYFGVVSGRSFVDGVVARLHTDALARELHASQIKLSDAIENLPDGFVLFDSRDRLVLCNQRFRELYPHVADVIVPGASFVDITIEGARRLARNGRFMGQTIDDWLAQRLARHRDPQAPIEIQIWGEDRWMRIAEHRTADGGIVGVHTDITARKLAERALLESQRRQRDIASNIPGVVFRRTRKPDGALAFSYVSRDFFGIDSLRFVTDPSAFVSTIHPEDRPAYHEAVERSATTLTPMNHLYRVAGVGGGYRWVRSRATPHRIDNGDVIWDGVAIDETEQHQAEERARAHAAEIAHLLRLTTMGEMASALAHQLGQPLNAIGNYTRGALRLMKGGAKADDAKLVQAMELAVLQADRAADIVRGIADFIRKSDRRFANAAINDVVGSAIVLVRAEIDRQAVKLHLDLASGLPGVKLVAIEIEQIIVNLVRNAIEAMSGADASERNLTIKTEQRDDEIVVAITDTGTGFEAAMRERIFDAFYSTKTGNVGMGLSISRTLAEAHGGTLRAYPNKDCGATFELKLPVGGGGRGGVS